MITTYALYHCLASLWNPTPVCIQTEMVFRHKEDCEKYIEEHIELIEPDERVYCSAYKPKPENE